MTNTVEINNFTMNFSTLGASTNSTTQSIGPQEILESCLQFTTFLFGFPTHCYITWLIITGTGNGLSSELFNLNLSVSEIGNCLNNLLIASMIWFPGLLPFKNFLTGLTITARPFFQCLMCVERYLAVVHPVTFLKYKPLRYRVICCIVVWMFTIASCFGCWVINTSDTILYVWFSFVHFLCVLFVQLFCLVAVLRALKQSGPGERKREKEENHMKKNAIYTILVTTVNMLVTYIPLCLTGLYSILSNNFVQAVWFPSVMCFMLAGFFHPLLFLHRTGKLPYSCHHFHDFVLKLIM
ncbi:G-protein coupled receptor 4-like [Danio aesculapii]|uniref:G-protein coupled receptor 4-like n=1 Tax=Danio aesculapii TaxID=1142201 RepID=UPI0024BF21AB|nr:G-protein coupled receptor 4-like [Danio aesculapii]